MFIECPLSLTKRLCPFCCKDETNHYRCGVSHEHIKGKDKRKNVGIENRVSKMKKCPLDKTRR